MKNYNEQLIKLVIDYINSLENLQQELSQNNISIFSMPKYLFKYRLYNGFCFYAGYFFKFSEDLKISLGDLIVNFLADYAPNNYKIRKDSYPIKINEKGNRVIIQPLHQTILNFDSLAEVISERLVLYKSILQNFNEINSTNFELKKLK